jgi:hypothetical protein
VAGLAEVDGIMLTAGSAVDFFGGLFFHRFRWEGNASLSELCGFVKGASCRCVIVLCSGTRIAFNELLLGIHRAMS